MLGPPQISFASVSRQITINLSLVVVVVLHFLISLRIQCQGYLKQLFSNVVFIYFFGSKSTNCEEYGDYVRHIFSLVPGSTAVIGILALLLFQAPQTQCMRNSESAIAGSILLIS